MANAVDERDFGIAAAAQQMVGQIGVVIGIQVMQSIQLALAPEELACLEAEVDPCVAPSSYLDRLSESYAISYLTAAAVAAVAIVFAVKVRRTEYGDVTQSGSTTPTS